MNLMKMGRYTYWLLLLFCMLPLFAYAGGGPGGGGGGGGGGGNSLSCNTPVSNTMPGNSTATNPTTTNCLNGPGYYTGSDVNGDGCEDVQYSVENNTFFTFTAPAGSGCQTYTANFSPSPDLNLQGSWFPPDDGNSCAGGCDGSVDGGDADHHDGGMNGSGNSFSLSMTLCDGETSTVMTDGYAGDADGSYTLEIVCPILLNVELIHLKTKVDAGQTHLEWIVANDDVGNRYIVERSSDAIFFKAIYELPSLGTHQDRQTYQWVDPIPIKGQSYYRIRRVLADNSEELSIMAAAYVDAAIADFEIGPNPVVNQLNIQFSQALSSKAELKVMSSLGEQVYRQAVGANVQQVNLDLSTLPKGNYFLIIGNTAGNRTRKFCIVD